MHLFFFGIRSEESRHARQRSSHELTLPARFPELFFLIFSIYYFLLLFCNLSHNRHFLTSHSNTATLKYRNIQTLKHPNTAAFKHRNIRTLQHQQPSRTSKPPRTTLSTEYNSTESAPVKACSRFFTLQADRALMKKNNILRDRKPQPGTACLA